MKIFLDLLVELLLLLLFALAGALTAVSAFLDGN
jgi:hypothetical protein